MVKGILTKSFYKAYAVSLGVYEGYVRPICEETIDLYLIIIICCL